MPNRRIAGILLFHGSAEQSGNWSLNKLCSPIDKHTHAGSIFNNRVTLTFDLSTTGSMHAERLPGAVCLPRLVLIAQAVFPLERGHILDTQTHKVADATDHRTHGSAIAGVGS